MLQYPILEYSPYETPFLFKFEPKAVTWPRMPREQVFGDTRLCARVSSFASSKPLCHCMTVLAYVLKTRFDVRVVIRGLCPGATEESIDLFLARDKHGVAPWVEIARRLGDVVVPSVSSPSPSVLLCQTPERQRVFVFVDQGRVQSILSASRLKPSTGHKRFFQEKVSVTAVPENRSLLCFSDVRWQIIQMGN